jgi:ribosomal protein S27E
MAGPGITLAQLASSGRHVVVQCGSCPHRTLLPPAALGVPMVTAVTLAGAKLKCSACGSKQVLTYPESSRDVRKGRTR